MAKRRSTDLGIILSVYEWFCSKTILANIVRIAPRVTLSEQNRHENMLKLIQYQKNEFDKLQWSIPMDTSSSDTSETSLVQDPLTDEVLNETINMLKFV